MINKKDPLIESVKKIMLENEIRRTVTKNLNEELGIQSINNLPHEQHSRYNAILEQNINAALLGEKVEMTKQQFAGLDGNPKFTGKDLALARAGHHKKLAAAGKLEELTTDPYAEQQAGSVELNPPKPKPKPTITPSDQKALGDKIKSIKEEQLNEKITGKTDIGDAIKDFRASKSKQLAGRSSEERRKAAIAAVLQARREKK